MTNWSAEVTRAAAETLYWRHYRNSDGPQSTFHEFRADVIPEEELLKPWKRSVNEGDAKLNNRSRYDNAADDDSTVEWLRRFARGHWMKTTGRYVFTTPRPKRLAQLRAFIDSRGLLTPVALADHTEPHSMAEAVAAAMGFDRFADQTLLAGTFRGMFTATALEPTLLIESVLLIHFLKGDSHFRVREIQVHYNRCQGEEPTTAVQRAGDLDFDEWRIRDGFASFGTNYGEIFLLRAHDGSSGGYAAAAFEFTDKGRRVSAFRATPGDDPGTQHQFRLCCRPTLIDRALQLLWRISDRKATVDAAE